MDEFRDLDQEYRNAKLTAQIASTISIITIILAIVTVPILYTFAHKLQDRVNEESDFCKVMTRDMWKELSVLQSQPTIRQKRGWMFGQWIPSDTAKKVAGAGGSAASFHYNKFASPSTRYSGTLLPRGSRCPCQQGPPGPPGPPGDDGRDGKDGNPGRDGKNGRDGVILPADTPMKEPCIICPPGPRGNPGPPGERGPPGPRGPAGRSGQDGKRGEQGMPGPAGPMGRQGPPGRKGKRGEDGKVIIVVGPAGPPGKKGPVGPKGPKGPKGVDGKTINGKQGPRGDPGARGKPGKRGPPGPMGPMGEKGPDGDCSHCPVPRLPPGY